MKKSFSGLRMDSREPDKYPTLVASKTEAAPVAPVAAIVVTYHPDAGFPERLAAVADQVHRVVIVDNRSNPEAIRMLQEITMSRPRVDLLLNSSNLGIAAALNRGVRHAISAGYTWVLTLDQDSRPVRGMVKQMLAAYEELAERDKPGVVAPVPVDEQTGRSEFTELCGSAKHIEAKTVLTSGSLIPAFVFAASGPFRENFFIDYVDDEFCLRLRRIGYSVVVACEARLLHNLGHPTYHRFLWKSRAVTSNHAPLRRYYITRNRLLLMKEYVLREPLWVAEEARAFLKDTVKMLLFESGKKEKFGYYLKGAAHALLNRTGKLSPKLSTRENG